MDELIATRVMGLTWAETTAAVGVAMERCDRWVYWRTCIGIGRAGSSTWSPSTDLRAAFEMEVEIERRSLTDAYVHALIVETGGSLPAHDLRGLDDAALWALVHATPAQRARAALRAVGVEDHYTNGRS